MLKCPRDQTELVAEQRSGIEVDRCPTCSGRWLDHGELDQLEAVTAPDEGDRRATIEYSKRASELACPACAKPMRAFNYRAYNLEMDTCEDGHGFWLDAGEESRVGDIMEERVQGLERAATAEQAWDDMLGRLGKKSVWDNIKGMFGGKK
jgi:Zn-finger nucleic acid-binding protein